MSKDVVQSFLEYLKHERRYSKHTIKSYQTDLNQFEKYCALHYELNSIHLVNYQIIRSWLAHLMNEEVSTKTINRKLSSLKSFYKFLLKKKWIKENPTTKIAAPKIQKRLPVYLEETEMNTLFLKIKFKDDFMGIQDKLIMELLYTTGIRLSELVNLKHQDIDYSSKQIKVLGKGNKERIIPLHKSTMDALQNFQKKKSRSFLIYITPICLLLKKANRFMQD